MFRSLAFVTVCLVLVAPHYANAQLMDKALQDKLDAALPTLSNIVADDALHGRLPGKRLFYTSNEMPHLQQDFVGGVMHFHRSDVNRAANKVQGLSASDLEFPWKEAGGTDNANTFSFKIKFIPDGTIINVHRADMPSFFDTVNGGAFSRTGSGVFSVSGYDWDEPIGTRNYEIISFGDRLLPFEVRARTKVADDRWVANIYRPFTRESFAAVARIPDVPTKVAWQRKAAQQSNPAFDAKGYTEVIPGLPTKADVDRLIKGTTFKSVLNIGWADDIAAPTTHSETSIIPRGYEGAIVGATRDGCKQCHQDAGTHVRFFDPNRDWYGFVRGSVREKDLSFHPVDPVSFSPNGNARRLVLNTKLVQAGWVQWVESPNQSAMTSVRRTSELSPVLNKFKPKVQPQQQRPINANAGAPAGSAGVGAGGAGSGVGAGRQCNN